MMIDVRRDRPMLIKPEVFKRSHTGDSNPKFVFRVPLTNTGLIVHTATLTKGVDKMCFFRSVLVLFLISAAFGAADPFVGIWKLNVEKSDFGDSRTAKSGSTTYEATGTGYTYVAATVFGEDQVERLQIPVEFDGTAHEGRLGGRKTIFVSRKIDDNSYEFVFTDKETGKVTQTFRYTVSTQGNTLTFISLNSGKAKPQLTLVYDKQ